MISTRTITDRPGPAEKAFSLIEVLAVVVGIVLLAALILPSFANCRCGKARRINCANNLKQVGLAFRLWGDDNGVYPMLYQSNDFDGPSFALQQKMYVYFQAMSNELNNTKIVVCPSDTGRTSATNFFSDFSNSNVSYFVGRDADETMLQMFLAGDRHIDNGTPPKNGLLDLTTNQPAHWTRSNHKGQGNVGLADGSVQGYTSRGLQTALQHTGTNLTRLAMP